MHDIVYYQQDLPQFSKIIAWEILAHVEAIKFLYGDLGDADSAEIKC